MIIKQQTLSHINIPQRDMYSIKGNIMKTEQDKKIKRKIEIITNSDEHPAIHWCCIYVCIII